MSIILFALLLVVHYICDYVAVTPTMLAAKKHGTPIEPILDHALSHALGMAVVLGLWGVGFKVYMTCVAFQLFTHWGIDILKGRLAYWYPATAGNPQCKTFWYFFGLDQLAHQLVIATMVAMTL